MNQTCSGTVYIYFVVCVFSWEHTLLMNKSEVIVIHAEEEAL